MEVHEPHKSAPKCYCRRIMQVNDISVSTRAATDMGVASKMLLASRLLCRQHITSITHWRLSTFVIRLPNKRVQFFTF